MPLPTVSRLFGTALRTQLVPVAHVSSKPAKHKLAIWEQAIAMVSLYAACLIPPGWILSHIQDYKKRE